MCSLSIETRCYDIFSSAFLRFFEIDNRFYEDIIIQYHITAIE